MGLKNTSKFQKILEQNGSGCCLDLIILKYWIDSGKYLDPSMLGVGHISQHIKNDYYYLQLTCRACS